MDKYVVRFLVEKVIAIAMIAVGIHLLVAYMGKTLPFGITCNSMAIMGVWAYLGIFISIFVLTGGVYLLVKEFVERWIRKNLR